MDEARSSRGARRRRDHTEFVLVVDEPGVGDLAAGGRDDGRLGEIPGGLPSSLVSQAPARVVREVADAKVARVPVSEAEIAAVS